MKWWRKTLSVLVTRDGFVGNRISIDPSILLLQQLRVVVYVVLCIKFSLNLIWEREKNFFGRFLLRGKHFLFRNESNKLHRNCVVCSNEKCVLKFHVVKWIVLLGNTNTHKHFREFFFFWRAEQIFYCIFTLSILKNRWKWKQKNLYIFE